MMNYACGFNQLEAARKYFVKIINLSILLTSLVERSYQWFESYRRAWRKNKLWGVG